MPLDIRSHLTQLATDRTPLWIDGWQYGQRLLNRGEAAPWHDAGAFVSFFGRLQGLLRSDVLVIEVAAFYRKWLQDNPGLLAAMGEKRRLGYALRTLLADQHARAPLHEIVKAVCDTNPGLPLVLALPSPRQWMGEAYCRAKGLDSVEVSWDDAESGAMYVADFLRVFADCDVSGLLLRDAPGAGPADASDVARYQPVINVARHYRWQVVLDGCADGCAADPGSGVSLCLGSPDSDSPIAKFPAADWDRAGSAKLAGKLCAYVEIPPEAVPEQVLESLGRLRDEPGRA